jgi:phage terminase Nu1 subunit (DNA packaging protein)
MGENYRTIDDKFCISTGELCNQLGINRKTLTDWEAKGCPKAARGWWPLWDILRWKGVIGGGKVIDESQAEELSLAMKKLKYEAELKKQKAEEATMENAITRGEYIHKDEITAELKRFFVVLKRSMLGYSRRIATEISPYVDAITARRIEKMITDLTTDALEQISIDGIYKAPKKKATR